MPPIVYPTVQLALEAITDPYAFERFGSILLIDEYPGLEWTGGPGDRGRDALVRLGLFQGEEMVVQYSLEKRWTGKIHRELARYGEDETLPRRMVFVTPRDTRRSAKKLKKEAADKGVELEILGLGWFVPRLEGPQRELAERHLNLAPRLPSRFVDAAELVRRRAKLVPGFDAPLVGANATGQAVEEFIRRETMRCLLVRGPGGVGKTRVVSDAIPSTHQVYALSDGACLDRDAVGDLPAGGRIVVFIDDAHRVPDLSGVRMLIDDHRWEHAKIVMTARPGWVDDVRRRACLDPSEIKDLMIGPLGRAHIDQLLRNTPHHISDHETRLTLIQISEGNPLLAHMAAGALRTGGLAGAGLVDLLRVYLQRRLEAPDQRATSNRHRLVLGIVAAIGTVSHEELGSLQVPGPCPHVRQLVADLADVGALYDDGEHVTVKPDVLAPIIVADTFLAERLLDRVGDYSRDVRPLVHEVRRPHALAVLADAVKITNADRSLLQKLVTSAWPVPTEKRASVWMAALKDAYAVAPTLSDDVDELLSHFVQAWPLDGPLDQWGTDAPASLLKTAAEAAKALADQDMGLAVTAFLSLAKLEAETEPASPEGVMSVLTRLLSTAIPERPGLAIRDGLIAYHALNEWLDNQDQEQSVFRVAVDVLTALLTSTYEFVRPDSAQERRFYIGAVAVPKTEDHGHLVQQVTSTIIELLSQLDERGLGTVVDQLKSLRLDARNQGLPLSDIELPQTVRKTMGKAAKKLAAALVDRWDELPSAIRFKLAQAERHNRKVTERMKTDDLIGHLLILAPNPPKPQNWRREEQRTCVQSAALADQLGPAAALNLLIEGLPIIIYASRWRAGLWAFAKQIGRTLELPDASAAIERVAALRCATDNTLSALLAGMVEQHGESAIEVLEWACENADTAWAVPSVLDDLSSESERRLLNSLVKLGATSVDRAVMGHLGYRCRLSPIERGTRLLDVAQRLEGEHLAELLATFGPEDQYHHIPLTDPAIRDRVKSELHRLLTSETTTAAVNRVHLEPLFTALAGLDTTGLVDVLAARAASLTLHNSGYRKFEIDGVLEAFQTLSGDACDLAIERLAALVQDPILADTTIRREAIKLLREVGKDVASYRKALEQWVESASNRDLAIMALDGQWDNPLFDTIARKLIRKRLTQRQRGSLLWAADIHSAHYGFVAQAYRHRASYFDEWAKDTSPYVRSFGQQAAQYFRQQAAEEDRRERRYNEDHL